MNVQWARTNSNHWAVQVSSDSVAPGGRWVWCEWGKHYVAGPLDTVQRGLLFKRTETGCLSCLTARGR